MKEILASLRQYSSIYLRKKEHCKHLFRLANLRTKNGDWYCPSYAGFSLLQGSEIKNSRHIITYSTVSGLNVRQRRILCE